MTQPDGKTVLLLKPRGFCAGVVRAIDIVRIALDAFGPPIYVRKEIVHNRYVVEELTAMPFVDVMSGSIANCYRDSSLAGADMRYVAKDIEAFRGALAQSDKSIDHIDSLQLARVAETALKAGSAHGDKHLFDGAVLSSARVE